jgi:phenylacetate-CoA ligase
VKKYHRPLASQDSLDFTRVLLSEQVTFPSLSRSQIEMIQTMKLRAMLAYAKANSEWYRSRFKHIEPETFTLEHLDKLPIMNKRDLMEHWDEIVTDKRLKMDDASRFLNAEQSYDLFFGHHIFASGGSSGRRGMFVWDSQELALALAALYRYQYRDEFKSGVFIPNEPLMVVSIGALRPVHLSETVFSLPIVPQMSYRAFSALAPIDELVEDLNDCQPTHMNGYPSVIARLAAKALKGKLKIHPRRIIVGAEPLLEGMVNAIYQAWPEVILINNWGSTDSGIHAVACDHSAGNLHLIEDMNIIECVDEKNNPIASGVCSEKILITNLFRKSMPIFRYEMDDRVLLLNERCACGSEFKLISSIEGRHEDDFVYDDIIVIAEVFENVIMVEQGVDEYQVFQTKEGANILIVPDKGADINQLKMKADLIAQLKQLGLAEPIVNVEIVQELKRHPETGKLKRFKCL